MARSHVEDVPHHPVSFVAGFVAAAHFFVLNSDASDANLASIGCPLGANRYACTSRQNQVFSSVSAALPDRGVCHQRTGTSVPDYTVG